MFKCVECAHIATCVCVMMVWLPVRDFACSHSAVRYQRSLGFDGSQWRDGDDIVCIAPERTVVGAGKSCNGLWVYIVI